ncbi:hypothetical protein DFH07DRAFT_862489 [Mycena maculata]|uniref:NADH-ubiquinone oxidoreductase B15 subunit n=1 Tax=Mycena maculata TaxID=230809 RepID=A0AAD7MGJ2_9AGAR|nr:hypothetical protein DFH07DRAFT_862489 [Mycena maculata]
MSGDGHAHVKVQDAAIERHSLMREEQYKHFRWTNRTVRSSMWGAAIIPVGLFLVIYANQNKWDWSGKRKDQTLSK